MRNVFFFLLLSKLFYCMCLCVSLTSAQAAPHSFSFNDVKALAQSKAQLPYTPAHATIDDAFQDLDAQEWQSLTHIPQYFLWKDEHLPFVIEFLPPGFLLQASVKISVITEGKSSDVRIHKGLFSSPNTDIINDIPQEFDAGGFRILYPLEHEDTPQSIASFIGSAFFRALGRHAYNGTFARGLAINTALAQGEEFPAFSHVWFVKPTSNAHKFTVYALMESPSITGAFSFVIEPGTSTVIHVNSVLFPRKGMDTLEKIGIAPFASMFFAPHDSSKHAHNADGFLYVDAQKMWYWRPLNNPERLTISLVRQSNPQGFGLIQRHISTHGIREPLSPHGHRSSLWVEPKGSWGQGHLELIEIPTRGYTHNNIALFWVPENGDEPFTYDDSQGISHDYTLYWISQNATPHVLAKVIDTKYLEHEDDADVRIFRITFAGEVLDALPEDMGLTSVLEIPHDVELLEKHLTKNLSTGDWSLTFTVRLPKPESVVHSLIPMRTPKIVRLKAYLKRGENLPAPISEIWHYDLTL